MSAESPNTQIAGEKHFPGHEAITLRAARWIYLLYFSIGALLAYGGMTIWEKEPDSLDAYLSFCTGAVIVALSYIWISRFRIIIDATSMTICTLWKRCRKIAFDNVLKVSVDARPHRFKSAFHCAIHTRADGEPLEINPYFLNDRDRKRLLESFPASVKLEIPNMRR